MARPSPCTPRAMPVRRAVQMPRDLYTHRSSALGRRPERIAAMATPDASRRDTVARQECHAASATDCPRGHFATRRACQRDRLRQAARDRHGAHAAMTRVGKRLETKRNQPRSMIASTRRPPASAMRIDGDMAGLRVLDQLILDDVRQRLAQARPSQRRQFARHHQQVARGDHQHRRARARQQRKRGAAARVACVATCRAAKRATPANAILRSAPPDHAAAVGRSMCSKATLLFSESKVIHCTATSQ